MKSNMCVRCVLLFEVFSFGLIISLDAMPPRIDVSSDAIYNLKLQLLLDEVYSACFENDVRGSPQFIPPYTKAVNGALDLLTRDETDWTDKEGAINILITATKAMVLKKTEKITDREVDDLWANYNIADDKKTQILKNINEMVKDFLSRATNIKK